MRPYARTKTGEWRRSNPCRRRRRSYKRVGELGSKTAVRRAWRVRNPLIVRVDIGDGEDIAEMQS